MTDATTATDDAFRASCRAWLRDHRPPRPAFAVPQGPLDIATPDQLDYFRRWQRAAYDAGLVGCDYPEAYGGRGRTGGQRIANEEMQAAGAPFFPNLVGLGMAGPAIFHHGSEAQKRRFLPKLLSCDELWCQGFSEPGAGSDLASVQTIARRDADGWRITGHKVWTSMAQLADWMILLCRTDAADKYGGLTFFLAPIRASLGRGVAIRPLIKMTGEAGFNEVLFDDLALDDGHRLDAAGRGWAVAMTTLLHERGAGSLVTPHAGSLAVEAVDALDDRGMYPAGSAAEGQRGSIDAGALPALARRCRRAGARVADDAWFRDAIVDLLIRARAVEEIERLANVPGFTDPPGRLALQHKLLHSELAQDVARLACAIEGMASTYALDDASGAGRWPLAHMSSYGFTIAAGSSEIQRNILGERVLGLPKSR